MIAIQPPPREEIIIQPFTPPSMIYLARVFFAGVLRLKVSLVERRQVKAKEKDIRTQKRGNFFLGFNNTLNPKSYVLRNLFFFFETKKFYSFFLCGFFFSLSLCVSASSLFSRRHLRSINRCHKTHTLFFFFFLETTTTTQIIISTQKKRALCLLLLRGVVVVVLFWIFFFWSTTTLERVVALPFEHQ